MQVLVHYFHSLSQQSWQKSYRNAPVGQKNLDKQLRILDWLKSFVLEATMKTTHWFLNVRFNILKWWYFTYDNWIIQ